MEPKSDFLILTPHDRSESGGLIAKFLEVLLGLSIFSCKDVALQVPKSVFVYVEILPSLRFIHGQERRNSIQY